MKKHGFILAIALGLAPFTFSQTINYVTSSEYALLKSTNSLTGNEVLLSEGMVNPGKDGGVNYVSNYYPTKATGCSGYFAPPGPAYNITWSTDDGYSPVINLPFTFCFFGDNYTSVYMNNNGNISFNNGISTFSSNAFPSNGNTMIAAFWADFDFGGTGTMHATITPTAAIFNWVAAGYFSSQTDKINTCQIVITDGTDPLITGGNCAIHYADMQWTTGSASSGVNGFGGTPATAGANRGNNIDYFQIGRFDHAGVDYDGPTGANDGVSWLDNKSFFFDFCSAGSNIPPVPLQTNYCDTFTVCNIGDTLDISFPFLSPEAGQITNVVYSAPTLTNVVVLSNVAGNTGEITLRIIGALETIGVHDLTITATDNYAVNGVTTVLYKVKVVDGSTAFPTIPELVYTPGCSPVNFTLNEAPFDSYLWSYGSGTNNNVTITSGYNAVLSVQIENQGCKMIVDSLINVMESPSFNFIGSFTYCTNQNNTFLQIPDSLNLLSANWENTTNPGVSIGNDFSNTLIAGTYMVTITESSGVCSNDTTFSILSVISPQIFNDTLACDLQFQVNGTIASSGGTWSSSNPAVLITPNSTSLNPMISATTAGTYTVSFTDNACNEVITSEIIFPAYPAIFNDSTLCSLNYQVNGTQAYNNNGVWSSTSPNITFTASANTLNPTITSNSSGIYSITFTDAVCNNSVSANLTLVSPPEIFDDAIGCNHNYQIENTLAYNGGVWTVSDTAVHFVPSTINSNPLIYTSTPGTYILSFTDNQCNMTVSSEVYFPPYAYTQVLDSVICVGSTYTIYAQENSTVTDFVWNTGATGPSIIVTEPGDYIVTASNVCHSYTDTATIGAKVCDIIVPNIIVLSSLVGNNTFFVEYAGVETFDCAILNRYGNVIFEYTDPAGSWDGRTKGGDLVNEGTYFYRINAKFHSGEEVTKHGFVQVKY